MVKLTTLLMTGATILAMSASSAHAAAAGESSDVMSFSGADDLSVIATDPIVGQDFENFPEIVDDEDEEAGSLVRRAADPTKPKKPTKPIKCKKGSKSKKCKGKPVKPTKVPKPTKVTKPTKVPKPTKTPKPTKAPKPTQAPKPPQSGLDEEQQAILDAHNLYRARHGAKPLVWDSKAAAHGSNWIQQCQFRHSQSNFGENLAYGYRDFTAAIKAWYDEEPKYNYNNPGFSMATGHFTQVVWKGTTAVGCAKKFCNNLRSNIYICNYSPPGNMMGAFPQNVSPPRN
ncbi:hypothetical protein BGZ73_005452 [Actinomortierella ambigua]|nr:hypothetical protein BGZ73_005452 [Actinomortierella ambigua]